MKSTPNVAKKTTPQKDNRSIPTGNFKLPKPASIPTYKFPKAWEQLVPGGVCTVIKADLHHIDGTTSQIKLMLPSYEFNFDHDELAGDFLALYIKRLTEDYIKIDLYQISVGQMHADGTERYSRPRPIVQAK